MSTADQNLISQYHQVIIIGSGTAGLSAAYQLHKSGVKSVIILEGSKRIGGRILTEYLDENLSKPLEMGACWMHGLQGNPVYELAQRENFPAHTGTILNFDIGTCVDENGLYISSELHHEVDQFFDSLLQDTRDLFEFQQINNTQLSSSSIHKVFLEKFENFLNSNAGDNGTRSLKLKLLQRRFDQETGECGCQSMEQVSYSEFGSYQRPKGPDMEFPSGYSTLIRYLFSQIPQDWILFEQFVENILWDTDKHVKITCANGNIYECEQLICTIPLAVMKWSYKSLFTPALPAWKSEAIQKMDMGTVDKIYLFYDKIDFFTGDSLAIVYDREHDTLDIKKEWYKKIFLFQKVYDNVLLCWITGDEAIFCEQLNEKYIGDVLTNLFRKTLKSAHIPTPTKVVRTQWFSNPCSKGSYSYVPVGASSCQHIRDLAEPLKVQDKSRVHFAGEHTHTRFYSTVTGAFITGQAQALEIIQELNTKNDTEMLVKANTDDFNKMQWKREEPP
ncbi:unnamed protein product [Rotaria socialis]|uniref:Amine oxidase domain-containing protein n=1 Tax=Rotaria socialis TaxID=392032 RepID=A0A820VFC2_9BILA|nr:unnamed protein product [Rotaria socialis]CAF3611277.1 unnamed protein product [Rotaria socialis]CAF4128311.1 unnamed protein product [Rotaria socialis]CAF4499337.1 unnamed protein product [Rotaria socialis]